MEIFFQGTMKACLQEIREKRWSKIDEGEKFIQSATVFADEKTIYKRSSDMVVCRYAVNVPTVIDVCKIMTTTCEVSPSVTPYINARAYC